MGKLVTRIEEPAFRIDVVLDTLQANRTDPLRAQLRCMNWIVRDAFRRILRRHLNYAFVSFPIDVTGTVDVLFDDSINGDGSTTWDVIQWYDNANKEWRTYSIYKPAVLNDMDMVGYANGFWVHLLTVGDGLLTVGATGSIPGAPSVDLFTGWNLVGYPSHFNYNTTLGLNNLTYGTHVDAIWTFNASSQKWQEIGSSDSFELGRGYWIHATQECVWEVPL